MGKDLTISILLDIYGSMLTDKQRNVVELYYNEDLSLAEISEHEGITRQGVRDSIKRGESLMKSMDEKLNLLDKSFNLLEYLKEIKKLAGKIQEENNTYNYSREISQRVDEIIELTQKAKDII